MQNISSACSHTEPEEVEFDLCVNPFPENGDFADFNNNDWSPF